MKDWKTLEKELARDPAIKAEFDRLEPEYQLARQLIQARHTQNITQAELAEKAGVKQAYIARLESGAANPTLASVSKISQALGMQLTVALSR